MDEDWDQLELDEKLDLLLCMTSSMFQFSMTNPDFIDFLKGVTDQDKHSGIDILAKVLVEDRGLN